MNIDTEVMELLRFLEVALKPSSIRFDLDAATPEMAIVEFIQGRAANDNRAKRL